MLLDNAPINRRPALASFTDDNHKKKMGNHHELHEALNELAKGLRKFSHTVYCLQCRQQAQLKMGPASLLYASVNSHVSAFQAECCALCLMCVH